MNICSRMHAFLLSTVPVCSILLACLPAEPGASPDAAASIDGGADLDGGPGDAGSAEGEGEGEGECIERIGQPEVDPDDAGIIHYDHCEPAGWLFGTCNDGSCATSETERQLVGLISEVAAARGYGDRIEVAEVHDDLPGRVVARVVVIADWMRALGLIRAELDVDGHVVREQVEADLPLFVPRFLPSVPETYARLRECAPDILVDGWCNFVAYGHPSPVNALIGGFGGQGSSHCIGAEMNLWDPASVDSGPSEVRCFEAEVPCCE